MQPRRAGRLRAGRGADPRRGGPGRGRALGGWGRPLDGSGRLTPSEQTLALWASQDRHPGDRWRLFRAVADGAPAEAVLYPGCFVDIAPSFVFPSVTYIDTDARAQRFFEDVAGVREIIADHGAPHTNRALFIHDDFAGEIGVADSSVDLLISLYAGLVSVHCTRYLRPGGMLLVNASHGDAAMVSLDARYRLAAAVISRSGDYSLRRTALGSYLQPRSGVQPTADEVRSTGRGVAYTRPAFAYLFERLA